MIFSKLWGPNQTRPIASEFLRWDTDINQYFCKSPGWLQCSANAGGSSRLRFPSFEQLLRAWRSTWDAICSKEREETDAKKWREISHGGTMVICLWELSTLWRNGKHQLHAPFCGLVLGGQCWLPPFYRCIDPSLSSCSPFPPEFASLLYSTSCWNVSKRRLWGLFEGGCISHILKKIFKVVLSEEGDRVKDGHLGWPEAPCDLAASERGALEKRWERLWKTHQNINCRRG